MPRQTHQESPDWVSIFYRCFLGLLALGLIVFTLSAIISPMTFSPSSAQAIAVAAIFALAIIAAMLMLVVGIWNNRKRE